MSVIGIGFGQRNSCIAVARKGGIDVVLNELSKLRTSSGVGYSSDTKVRSIGERALTQYARNSKNTVMYAVKSLIGRRWSDASLHEEAERGMWPFKLVQVGDDAVGVEVVFGGEKRTFSALMLTASLLQHLRMTAEEQLSSAVADMVISVPGWWALERRQALLDATKVSGMNCVRLINDNTATALGYGIYKTKVLPEKEADAWKVMFIDVGHATTKVSLVKFSKGKLVVVASAYEPALGGRDLDYIVFDYFCEQFKEKYKIDVRTNLKARIRLLDKCSAVKKTLSSNPTAVLNLDCLMDDTDVHGKIERDEFEALAKDKLELLDGPVKKVLEEAKVDPKDLHAVELTGSGARSTSLRNRISAIFGEFSQTTNAEESVARGCALQSAILSPQFRVKDFEVVDLVFYPIYLTLTDGEGKADRKLAFKANTSIPAKFSFDVVESSSYEIKAEYGEDACPPGVPTEILSFKVSSVPVAKHQKDGARKVKFVVQLNANGLLELSKAEIIEKYEVEEKVIDHVAETARKELIAREKKEKKEKEKEKEKEAAEAKKAAEEGSEAEPMETDQDEKKGEGEETEKKEEPKKEDAKEEKKKLDRIYKQVKKERIVSTKLEVKTASTALSDAELNIKIGEIEAMLANDKLAAATAEAKNAVETYVYSMRDKLSYELKDYATADEKSALLATLEEVENWLYEEGDDETKEVYEKKLGDMKEQGAPAVKRRREFEERSSVVKDLKDCVRDFKISATTDSPDYEHIPAEEKARVVKEVEEANKWLNEQLDAQEKLSTDVDPVLKNSDVIKKREELHKFCSTIMNAPKPKKKKDEKKEGGDSKDGEKDEKKEDEKKDESEEKKDGKGADEKGEDGDKPTPMES